MGNIRRLMRRNCFVALVLLSVSEVFAQGRGVPTNGYPDWAERMVLVYTNRSRADPVTDLASCTVCAEKACYPNPLAPVAYNYGISRASRFHSANMRLTTCFAHHSPCALVSDIATIWDSTCDGSAACACQNGTATCTSTPCTGCTTTFQRIGMFAPNASAENIAYGYATPRAMHYGWFHEPDTDSTCGFRTANGHRATMMSNHKSLGVGRSVTHYTQDFGSTGTLAGSLIAGGHEVGPQAIGTLGTGANNVEFRANYYDLRGAPLTAQVNVDGLCQNMTLERGSAANATYFTSMSLSGNTCRRYVFSFKDPSGTIVLLPENGSYGVGGAGCADWVATAPQACGGGGNTAPLILTAAAATPSPVTGKTVQLSVSAGDDTGEASLIYTWTASGGPNGATFSQNSSNAAKVTTATFSQSGSYQFTVSVADPGAAATTSSVNVQVNRSASMVTITPPAVTINPSTEQQFTANVVDQWNLSYPGAPVTWTTSGGGTVSNTGLFSAGTAEGGPFTITATSGAASSSSFVTISSGPPDTFPPVVAWTSPVHGTDAAGLITLAATATDNVGVAKVIFYVDNMQVGEDNSPPYTASWNADAALRGSHTLRARAVDYSGIPDDKEIVVNVPGGVIGPADAGSAGGGNGSDTTPPLVSILTPASGAALTGTVEVEASVTDNTGISTVIFQMDGVTTFATLSSPPWKANLDTTTFENGAHTLTVVARDLAGNQAQSAPVAITIGGGIGCGCTEAGGMAPLLFGAIAALLARRRART